MADLNYILNDPTTPDMVIAVNLPPKPAVMDFVVDGYAGPTQTMYTLEHQAACCYFTVVNAINLAVRYATKPLVTWAATQNLFVIPRAGRQLNAFYDRRALKFFYAQDPITRQIVYAANSTDVVSHEAGHAILDAIRPDLFHMQAMEVWAFHESFGDINAILNIMQHDEILDRALLETNGDIKQTNIISQLAEEMGHAIFNLTKGKMGHSAASLRNAVNSFTYTEPERLPRSGLDTQLISEPHNFSRVFTGAWYDILVGIYEIEKANGLPPKSALIIARDTMAMYTFGALPIAPATIRFYDAVAKAMMVIDKSNNYKYNQLMNDVFIRRGILLGNYRPLLSMDWTAFQLMLEPADDVFQQNSTIAVRNKRTEILNLPQHMVNVEAPGDSYYEFNGTGDCIDTIASTSYELIDHVNACVDFLKENDLIRPDRASPFEIDKHGNLIRSHFACGCGCLNNASIPGEPEYGKPWKSCNNSGCGCSSCGNSCGCGSTCNNNNCTSKRKVIINRSYRVAPDIVVDVHDQSQTTVPGEIIINEYEKKSICWTKTASEFTIVIFTVLPGYTFYLQGFTASSSLAGVYKIYADGVEEAQVSTVSAPLDVDYEFSSPISVTEGLQVIVTVINQGYHATDYEATIEGYMVPA